MQFLQSLLETDMELQLVLQRAMRVAIPSVSAESSVIMSMHAAGDHCDSAPATGTLAHVVNGLGQFTLTLFITPILVKVWTRFEY